MYGERVDWRKEEADEFELVGCGDLEVRESNEDSSLTEPTARVKFVHT